MTWIDILGPFAIGAGITALSLINSKLDRIATSLDAIYAIYKMRKPHDKELVETFQHDTYSR